MSDTKPAQESLQLATPDGGTTNVDDLSMELVANQAVSPGLMVSGFDQFRRTLAGGL